ncbi:phosphoglucosamine mutase [Candidatus Bathyarchaeota archaeon]|nr:MAG: phosphoglucosamine mutase [Candidatus Bathyarchaeota archaeon]
MRVVALNRRLFGTNGIRGVANVELTPEFCARVGLAIGTYFGGGEIIIGRDARLSGQMIANAVVSGLLAAGCKVRDVGLAPTPMIQYAVRHFGADGGVVITASHNPPEYNGIKVLRPDGVELSREQEKEVEEIYFEQKFKPAPWSSLGSIRPLRGALEAYIEAIKEHVDEEAIRKAGFKVALDPANSVGVIPALRLLKELGCKVVLVNGEIDGRFPGRHPEPKPENLGVLSKVVRSSGADLGVAYDGDADRSIFVDELGRVHWGDKSFAIVARWFLAGRPGEVVVTPVSSSSLVREVVEGCGGKLIWTKVGSVIVSHKMMEIGAKLGGEENGGIFFGPHQPVRDGPMSTALMLHILAEERRPLSALMDELPRYYLMKASVKCPHELKPVALERLRARFEHLSPLTIDGVRVWYEDGSSVLMRPSGTEPIFRLYAEARSEERVKEVLEEHIKIVEEAIEEARREVGGP